MNASEARKITDQVLETRNVNKLLDAVYAQIKQEAAKGNDSIVNPLQKLPQPTLKQQSDTVYDVLRKAGYKVTTENANVKISW